MTTATKRIDALDVLRGVAILGTLGTNIWIFTMPFGGGGEASAFDVESVLRFLANGKFLGMLTLMFGIGLELQYRSALRRGMRWPGWYLWRSALLLVEGLLHYILIFEYDVLMGYAVTSVIVAYLVGRSDRAVRAWMTTMAALHLLMIGAATAAAFAGGTAAPDLGTIGTIQGTWFDQVMTRIKEPFTYRIESVFIIPMSIVMFLAGSRLYRAGILENSTRGAALRTRVMVVGLGAGLPLNVATSFTHPALFLADRYLAAPLVAAGLIALVTAVVFRLGEHPGVLRTALTNVGRTALTSYMLQNLVAGLLCYSWGLNLAESLASARPWWVIGAWTAICAFLMVSATLWLRRFPRGPMEAAWQWAYLKPQPKRQSPREKIPA
ncbi:DUF418 domain-containing protein [Sinosporangium siamense]|uniref:DUF418 domain-containing protein n=1 Tax=Sinosporangium siamense TaxID=1367973 RepID=A0A919RER7_9ACTN|nr:DUF418 domain-containing protein [Sinosporangium siamense]GII91460.1 hypothetical protein Ssi02_16910 [Sinosporangium siamense]